MQRFLSFFSSSIAELQKIVFQNKNDACDAKQEISMRED